MKRSSIIKTVCHLDRPRSILSLLVILSTIITYIAFASSDRVSDKIYSVLQSNHFCSRRLNATHQVGCQSELGGNLGVIWIVDDSDDLEHILNTGPTPPYIAILKRNFFTRKTIISFKKHSDRISGVVFFDEKHDDSKARTMPFSPDDVCPNRYFGLYTNDTQFSNCKHPWQEESSVSGLLYEDIPFPIFLMNENTSINNIESCFKLNNVIETKNGDNLVKRTQAAYPLCGIQLDSFMMAAKDTTFCMNSNYLIDQVLQTNARCLTVDNHSIFAYLKPAIGPLQPSDIKDRQKPDTVKPQSVVMLVTKLSSISMFSEISPGADSTITSIITMLAVAEALGKVRNLPEVVKSKRNIAFAILDSEPFDYTGSSRMVYNMINNNSFPYKYYQTNITENPDAIQNMNLESIDYIINLDQMANYPSSDSMHFHSDPLDKSNEKLDKIYSVMKKIALKENVNLEREQNDLALPPASVQEFIKYSRALKSDNKLTGLVLSNYGKTYKNLLYHSIYDDSHNIYQTSEGKLLQHLVQVSNLVAKTLYEITFDVEYSDAISIDKGLVDELLYCYLKNATCHLFTRACRAGQGMPIGPIPTYKDPNKQSDDMNGAITANLLAYFIGDKIKDYNLTKCHSENYNSSTYNFQYINDKDEPISDGSSGTCIRSQVLMFSSDSPTYSRVDGEIVVDLRYPAWTVSSNNIRNPVRLYMIPSPITQWILFIMGIVVSVASFVIVRHVRDSLVYIGTSTEVQTVAST